MNEILLTADDLMRGDWVMRINVENPYPVQIHEILTEGVIVDNQNNHYINLSYSDIEPIILTKEILEKNDFYCVKNEDANTGYYVYKFANLAIHIVSIENSIFDIDLGLYHRKLIYGVHSLQHIFNFCNIKYKIEI
jgi:hypothetical protein